MVGKASTQSFNRARILRKRSTEPQKTGAESGLRRLQRYKSQPALSGKEVTMDNMQTSPGTPTNQVIGSSIQDLMKLIQDQGKTTMDQMAKIENKIDTKISHIEKSVDQVKTNVEGLQGKVTNLENRMGRLESSSRGSSLAEEFWRARRTVIFGPVKSTEEDDLYAEFKDFMVEVLKIQQWEADTIMIDNLAPTIKKRGGMNPGEIKVAKVLMATTQGRDRIFSKIAMLANRRGTILEIEVPFHLTGLFRSLEKKAYQLRQNGFRTSIRFEDTKETLQLIKREKDGGQAWQVVGDVLEEV